MTKYERNQNHISAVRLYLMQVVSNLQDRLLDHDSTKLIEPERSAYEGLDEHLEGFEYGSEEYRQGLKDYLGPALKHHYFYNAHHPEHYENGYVGMSLLDLIEMLADLRAVCDDKGKQVIDLEVNKRIHNMSDEVYQILLNTIKELSW